MGVKDDIWGFEEQPGEQYDYIPNPYIQQPNNNKKKYTTLVVTLIIIVTLMISGGIFAIVWAITDFKDGILLREHEEIERIPLETLDYNGQDMVDNEQHALYANRNVNQYLLTLEEYIPITIKVKDLKFNYEGRTDEAILTLELTNNSQYDNIELVLREATNEDNRIYVSELSDSIYSVYLDSHETQIMEYSIYSFGDEHGDKINIQQRGFVNLTLTVYRNNSDVWDTNDYDCLEIKDGSIHWDSSGTIYEINKFSTWGYNTLEIKEDSIIDN